LIVPFGEWALDRVATELSDWRASGLCRADAGVAVDISAGKFQEECFNDRVREILDRHDAPPSSFVFEITESLLLPDDRRCRDEIDRLAGLGSTLTIDDFGTGYSSLAVVQEAPIGQLKIAKDSVRDLEVKAAGALPRLEDFGLGRTIVSMAKEVGE
jgi:EAL domain-containing protein (putative c-di-GMP-specific phosphodiesterase class I)